MDIHDEVVISGIAGKFPECNSVDEFKEALFNGIDLISVDDRRFPPGLFGTPKRSGKLKDIDLFDANFFGISHKQATFSDPRQRLLLETVFEAIVDAGINPNEIRGSKTGVFVGCAQCDVLDVMRKQPDTKGYINIGLTTCMSANRVSYCFDFKGPSYALDTACSSGMFAISNAVASIESGECDYAIAAGVQINLHPSDTQEFYKLNMLSDDGKCKVFNKIRDGYVRSETVATVFLQKKSSARRVYATVLGAKTNCDGFKKEGITYPSAKIQYKLMKQLFNEKKLNPDEVSYVEAHGTGTTAGDREECQSIVSMFCQNRKDPLLIGAVKSNMGHAEIASALGSLTKSILVLETGIIPGNLHFYAPADDIPELKNGQLKVVDKNTPWKGDIVAANSFGLGGANAHIVLRKNAKDKINFPKLSQRLVQVSGRTEEAVKYFLDKIENKHLDDAEFLALVDQVHSRNIDGHVYRAYAVLGDNPMREIGKISTEKRPVWFVYTGMGCQWESMGKDLMKTQVFNNTIKKCSKALAPYGLDLEDIIVNGSTDMFNNDIVKCFISITATEIALTDVLQSLGVVPDGFIGHSLGEVGCGYANGDLTPEQAVLLAYARGYASINSKLPRGQMAAVGLSKEECSTLLPNDIIIACFNGKSSVTISGPEDSVIKFVEKLSATGVFAKLVNTANYAYHSKLIADAGPLLLQFLKKVIPEPKLRSSKWISTSNKESKWDSDLARYNSPEYHQNNFLNPVLFDQAYKFVPENAIVVEVAPHGLLQAILKKELGADTTNISVMNRNSPDNLQFLLSAIGRIYINGAQPNLRKLYNEVTFPVGRGTPMIAPLIKWDHSLKFYVPFYKVHDGFGEIVSIDISGDRDEYLLGHNIDGRVLMPATEYLVLVWKVLAKMHLKSIEDFPVVFENIKLMRATVLTRNEKVYFLINIMKQSGYFEIFESGSSVATGKIFAPKDIQKEFHNLEISTNNEECVWLTPSDTYKEFALRRYLYNGIFQGITESNINGTKGRLRWNNNWTSFLDTMMQITLLNNTDRGLFLPTGLLKLVIDPRKHLEEINDDSKSIPVIFDTYQNIVKSGGIEIVEMQVKKAPRRQQIQTDPSLESYQFIPFETTTNEFDLEASLKIAVGIILENNDGSVNVKFSESASMTNKDKILQLSLTQVFEKEPMAACSFSTTNDSYDVLTFTDESIENLTSEYISENLRKNGFILYQGEYSFIRKIGLPIVFYQISAQDGLYLLRKTSELPKHRVTVFINTLELNWIEKLQKAKEKNPDLIYLVSQGDKINGLIGLTKCLIREPEGVLYRTVIIEDKNVESFSLDSVFYNKQLSNDFTINIFKNNVWGSYRHIPLKETLSREVKHACVNILTPGDLTSFQWIERPLKYHESIKSNFCSIYYAALNFKDVMLALSKLQSPSRTDITGKELVIGSDYSGVTNDNKRVMGISDGAGIALQLEAVDEGFLWEVPDSWTLEEAATVPVVYATSYYALIIRGGIKPGQSVLIHAGAGGIGISAISIALSMGCEVFTTVSSQEKRDFLKKMFPQLKDENIGNSRNSTFESLIMLRTNKRGVDIILNSLAADLFQASLRCLANRGQFLEIGKADFMNSTPIDSKMFLKNCNFQGVLLDDLYHDQSEEKLMVKKLLEEGIKKGVVRPLPRTVFNRDEIEDAFRFFATGKHKGKVVIRIRDEKLNERFSTIQAIPKVFADSDKTYILIGGLGGFGLELTNWLIEIGAKNIVLNSRRKVLNGYQSCCLKKFKDLNINVIINTDDSSSLQGAQALISCASSLGPIGGIFNMALVLRDALFENQTLTSYHEVFNSKIVSGMNMDLVTRQKCPSLDYFVVFSSIACGRGNAGQSNYGMANSAMERLCEQRVADGLPGLAIQWGPIGDVGYLANIGRDKELTFGLDSQNIASCLVTLEKCLLQSSPVVASTVLAKKEDPNSTISGKSPVEAAAHVMGIKYVDLIDENTPLSQLGLDSLMSAEIKQILCRNYNIEVELEEISNLTFKSLKQLNNTKSKDDVTSVDPVSLTTVIPKDVIVELNKTVGSKLLFFIHPLEGHVEFMKPLAAKLQATIYGLQCTNEVAFNKITEHAALFVDYIKTIQKSGPYYLCGYSFGSSIAFEMGLQLEKQAETVHLVCIDGSPNYVKNNLSTGFITYDGKEESQLENLKHFTRLFDNVNHDKAKELFTRDVSWEQHINNVSEFISKETHYESEDIASAAVGFYKRCCAGVSYIPSEKLKGRVVLIRSTKEEESLSEDYDLNKICKETVRVHKINGDHKGILLGENLIETASIINTYLVENV